MPRIREYKDELKKHCGVFPLYHTLDDKSWLQCPVCGKRGFKYAWQTKIVSGVEIRCKLDAGKGWNRMVE